MADEYILRTDKVKKIKENNLENKIRIEIQKIIDILVSKTLKNRF